MCFLKWTGPEFGLGDNAFAVTEFIIKEIEEVAGDEKKKHAKGVIITKDYIEHGFEASDKWYAYGVMNEKGYFCWTVKVAQGKDHIFFNEEGESLFALNLIINDAIKKFIAKMLNGYLNQKIKSGPQKYVGKKESYKGPCICKKLANSNKDYPFPWKIMTNGGKFPENCFACSCGKNWFCCDCDENIWVEVKDEEAWEMLILYNGVARKKIGIYKKGVYLLQNLRDEGLIPLN